MLILISHNILWVKTNTCAYYFINQLAQKSAEPSEDDSLSDSIIPQHELWKAARLKSDGSYIDEDASTWNHLEGGWIGDGYIKWQLMRIKTI